MKWGYKHRTAMFGDDAEAFTSRLFLMRRNPNGHRRPDLISVNGIYPTRLSLEVKSGRDAKVSLVRYQLHYGITCEEDYKHIFGESTEQVASRPDNLSFMQAGNLPKNKVSYYYNIIGRNNDVTSDSLSKHFSTIKIEWQNQYIIPHEWIFYSFAIARHLRTNEDLPAIIYYLKEKMKSDVLEECSHYLTSKEDKQNWQSFMGSDVRAAFEGDWSITTPQGRDSRFPLLIKNYPDFESLKRVSIAGPCGSTIYAMVKPNDFELFNTHVRAVVERRKPLLERVNEERRDARRLLDDRLTSKRFLPRVKAKQASMLKRLAIWAPERDEEYDSRVLGIPTSLEDIDSLQETDKKNEYATAPASEDLSDVPI